MIFMSSKQENYEKRKEEILEKSRNTYLDEGIEIAELRGYRFGTVISIVLLVFLTGFSIFIRQFAMIGAMSVFFSAPLCVKNIVVYHFSKRKLHLVFAIGMAILFVGNSIFFVFTVLRGL
jgi:hypothetical protein